ncbi:MAG TPA: helix-turn-helix domain-containing protein [Solirubrobacteraceae bacterium]|jgi:AcrR family transcriptional regulator|nr:helix-turn-helix domain-containing protein [Solirubrobacteraceae bacterium]
MSLGAASTSPIPPISAAAVTRTRILDAALELFSEHGFEGTTLQQIADRLGFTKAALYYHFRSKDDLLQALIAPAIAELDALLDAYEQETDTPGQRRRFAEDYIDVMLGQRRLIAYMASDLAIVAHPAIAGGHVERRARLQAQLAGDGLELREQVRVTMATRAIGGVIAQFPDADPAELRAILIDATRALLRPRRRHPS